MTRKTFGQAASGRQYKGYMGTRTFSLKPNDEETAGIAGKIQTVPVQSGVITNFIRTARVTTLEGSGPNATELLQVTAKAAKQEGVGAIFLSIAQKNEALLQAVSNVKGAVRVPIATNDGEELYAMFPSSDTKPPEKSGITLAHLKAVMISGTDLSHDAIDDTLKRYETSLKNAEANQQSPWVCPR